MGRARAWVVLAAAVGCQVAAPRPAPAARDPRLDAADAALLAERWADAEARYEAVAIDAPDPAQAAACRYWIGVCRRARGDAAGAREAFGAALAAAHLDVQARARLGLADLAWEAGDWAAAREQYARLEPASLVDDDARRRARRLVGAAARAGDWDGAAAALPALAAAGADPDEVAALTLATGRRCFLVIAGEFPGPRREPDAPPDSGPLRLPEAGRWPALAVPDGDRWSVVGFGATVDDAAERVAAARSAGLPAIVVP